VAFLRPPVVSARIAGLRYARIDCPESPRPNRENIPLHRAKLRPVRDAGTLNRIRTLQFLLPGAMFGSVLWKKVIYRLSDAMRASASSIAIILDGARCATVQSSIAWPLS